MRSPFFSFVRAVFLAVAALGAVAGTLSASTFKHRSLSDLVQEAELIVEAEVIGIDHKNSEIVEPGDADMPHTFVTFSIKRLIKGRSSAGDTVTLRMLGGPSGQDRVTWVAGTPTFHLGDRDVLFVRGNGKAICPILGFEQGRLRVVRGAIYDAFGHDVWITPNGEIAPGDARIDVRTEGYPELPSRAPELRDGQTEREFEPPAGALRPDAAGMIAVIEQMMIAAQAQGRLVDVPTTESQDVGALLRVPEFSRTRPPAEPKPSAPRPHHEGDDA